MELLFQANQPFLASSGTYAWDFRSANHGQANPQDTALSLQFVQESSAPHLFDNATVKEPKFRPEHP